MGLGLGVLWVQGLGPYGFRVRALWIQGLIGLVFRVQGLNL